MCIVPYRNGFGHKISSLLISNLFSTKPMAYSSRRDTLEILSDLLANMQEPRRLTQLLHRSNLSYNQLRKYLTMVIEMDLAKYEQKPHASYLVTDEGKMFIEMVKKRTVIKPLVYPKLTQKDLLLL